METTSGSSWSCVPNEDDEPLCSIVFVQHLAGSVAWTGLGARVLVHFVVVLVIPGDSGFDGGYSGRSGAGYICAGLGAARRLSCVAGRGGNCSGFSLLLSNK